MLISVVDRLLHDLPFALSNLVSAPGWARLFLCGLWHWFVIRDDCFGTRPINAAKLLPFLKFEASPTEATRALAASGPMPGIVARRLLASFDLC